MKGGVAESTVIQLHPVLCCVFPCLHAPLLTTVLQDDAAEARSQFNLDRIVEVRLVLLQSKLFYSVNHLPVSQIQTSFSSGSEVGKVCEFEYLFVFGSACVE